MLIGSATPVERNAILLTDAPIHALALISHLQLHQPTRRANSVPVAVKQNYARGRVNHVVVEKALHVVLGMSFINATSTVVLFDSGASHSFISIVYVEKYNLPIALLSNDS
jgi:hypothetical protein